MALEQIYRAMARLASSEVNDPAQYLLEAERLRDKLKKKMLEELDIEEDKEGVEDESSAPSFYERVDYIKRLRKKVRLTKQK